MILGMKEVNQEVMRGMWRQMAHHNGWAIIHNEEEFLDQALIEFHRLIDMSGRNHCVDEVIQQNHHIATALRRVYSDMLYRGLQHGEEQAAAALWQNLLRIALKLGYLHADAEELAQETIRRILERLPQLRSPQGLLSWAFGVFRTVRRDMVRGTRFTVSLEADDDEIANELIGVGNMAVEIEEKLMNEVLKVLLHAKLANPLEQLTVLRVIMLNENPRDIARDLGLPLYRVRVAKHRALQRLRSDEQFMQIINDLRDNVLTEEDAR